eukprot:jgi/Picre1/28352/NNA_003758.t1
MMASDRHKVVVRRVLQGSALVGAVGLGCEKIIVLIGLSIMKTLLSNRLAKLQGYLFRAAFLRRVPLFIRNIGENVLLCGVAAVLEASAKRWISKIELTWRDQSSNEQADQRICEDVPLLTLWYPWIYDECVRVCDRGGSMMTVAAPNFGGLYKKQQSLEGEYRNMHYRLMHNSESVAFYNGTEKEGSLIKDMYSQVVKHTKLVLGKQWRFLMVQDFLLKYLGATVAVALIIGPFFGGHLRPEATVMGRAQMLSNMRYHTSVIISLFGALGTLGSSSRKFLKLGAYSEGFKKLLMLSEYIGIW